MESSDKDSRDFNYTEEELIEVLLKQLSDSREDFNIFAIRELKHYHSAKIIEELAAIVSEDSKIKKAKRICKEHCFGSINISFRGCSFRSC